MTFVDLLSTAVSFTKELLPIIPKLDCDFIEKWNNKSWKQMANEICLEINDSFYFSLLGAFVVVVFL